MSCSHIIHAMPYLPRHTSHVIYAMSFMPRHNCYVIFATSSMPRHPCHIISTISSMPCHPCTSSFRIISCFESGLDWRTMMLANMAAIDDQGLARGWTAGLVALIWPITLSADSSVEVLANQMDSCYARRGDDSRLLVLG